MTIRVLSFDFDGCLFHRRYIKSLVKDVIHANKDFLDAIKLQNEEEDYNEIYVFIGSNRQSYEIDCVNLGTKGSCFPAIERISHYLNAHFDNFILADLFGNLAAGTSFRRARDLKYKGEHSNWHFDESKASILYAQMHKIANENPDEEIIFDFFDDRGNGAKAEFDVLEKLEVFFSKHPELIPKNLTLHLNHYAGEKNTPLCTIQGKGFVDTNYRQTVKDMAKYAAAEKNCSEDIEDLSGRIDVATSSISPSLLTHRKALTLINLSALMQPPAQKALIKALSGVEKRAHSLRVKARELDREGASLALIFRYSEAAQKVETLHKVLSQAAKEYFYGSLQKEEFSRLARDALTMAQDELEQHSHWKPIFTNLSLAFAGLGIFYAAAVLVNKAVTGHFLFFKKDSNPNLNQLERNLDKLFSAPLT